MISLGNKYAKTARSGVACGRVLMAFAAVTEGRRENLTSPSMSGVRDEECGKWEWGKGERQIFDLFLSIVIQVF